jgi:DNA-binding response OmpR family regulator
VRFAAARTRALIVERQTALVPYLREALERAGHGAVVAVRSASMATLRRTLPDTILLGPGMTVRPFEAIRRIRRARPTARIVAIAYREDPLWKALALALGADDILGPNDDCETLDRCLGGSFLGQENGPMRRTS